MAEYKLTGRRCIVLVSLAFLFMLLLFALVIYQIVAIDDLDTEINKLHKIISTSSADEAALRTQFDKFKREQNKVYESPEEESKRFGIFRENVEFIETHNARYLEKKETFYLGVNQFADQTFDEFRVRSNGYIQPPSGNLIDRRRSFNASEAPTLTFDGDTQLSSCPSRYCCGYHPSHMVSPASKDWRTDDVVSPVKNQGNCDSSWAFSATGAIESQWARIRGKHVSLSEQQMVDCSQENDGCSDGLPNIALDYVINQGGLEPESDYPYSAQDGSCNFTQSKVEATVRDCYFVLPYDNEDALKHALLQIGPISVVIDASSRYFKLYGGGIYDNPSCSSTHPNQAVLAVGYGSVLGQDYWIIKNSWGVGWGEDGYIRIARNKNNMCGVATFSTFPIV